MDVVLCESCGRLGGERELSTRDGFDRIRLCPPCLGELALYATRDRASIPFLESMVRRGIGDIWTSAEEVYLLRRDRSAA